MEDYAIIADLSAGAYDFPAQVPEDLILQMARPVHPMETTPHAEERRLLYVALTRARRGSYLVADAADPSEFVTEIVADHPQLRVVGHHNPECPACGVGRMRVSNNQHSQACTCYPAYTYPEPGCYCCRNGYVGIDFASLSTNCGNPHCESPLPKCPQCHLGIIVIRQAGARRFFGCTRFSNLDNPCRFTMEFCCRCG